jgi:hypothetical protein
MAHHAYGPQTQPAIDDFLDPISIFPPTTNPDFITPINIPTAPHAFTAVDSQADTLTQSQMLKQHDMANFLKAQIPELDGLTKMDVFDLLPIAQKPTQARLLSSIWSYRRKRNPIGDIVKWKARLCVDGSQQVHGRDYWETYASVVSWASVRLLLLLSTILNLKSRQVDYTQAFPQAPLDDPVYMRLPQGFYVAPDHTLQQHSDPTYHDRSHFIKLKRNLYGCKQAARNWFAHLKKGLISLGFTPSKIDPCLYFRHDCILAVYNDNCLIFARDDSTIDDLIKVLSDIFLLQDQGDIQDYLGIRVSKDATTKTIQMQQLGLIESILTNLNLLHDSKPKDTPSLGILHPDRPGAPRQDPWNYRSIIGKLNYLAQNTRPDLSFAVHQCARYSAAPTALHELAVKRIGRYLLYTKDKGLILHPKPDFRLNMFVDADFAGLWHQEFSDLRDCALSRTGYIITYCDCPVHWASRLQTEVALSTAESEYIALSMATRELLPLRHLVLEIHKNSLINTPLNDKPFSKTVTSHLEATQIFEDNASCIVLAYSDGTKMRTKHISLKWHHFKDQLRAGHITITKIASSLNWVDLLTKPLTKLKHETLRKFIMGW